MDLGLGGRVALVLGASRGLGRSVAWRLGEEGCRVVITARSAGGLEETAESMRTAGIDVLPLRCDVTDKTSIAELFATVRADVGDPAVVVYNNGGPADSRYADATDEEFMHGYLSQVMGFLWIVREASPAMERAGWGRIVTLGSMAAKEPHREMPLIVHNVVRPAALGLSKSLSVELGAAGITVNTIGTGLIDGGDDNSFRKTVRGQADKLGVTFDDLLASRLATVPLGRGGRPDEVGSLVAYVCSDLAGFLTGQLLVLDGGKVHALY